MESKGKGVCVIGVCVCVWGGGDVCVCVWGGGACVRAFVRACLSVRLSVYVCTHSLLMQLRVFFNLLHLLPVLQTYIIIYICHEVVKRLLSSHLITDRCLFVAETKQEGQPILFDGE